MSNPVNIPKSSTATQVPVAKVETPTTEKPTNGGVQEQKGIEVSPQVLHPQIIESKSANTVFERLDEGLKMKEQFNKSKERVGEFEDFSKNYEDEGLVMKIANVGTGATIQIQNVEMILDFINNLVKSGKTHLKALETEIVNFTI